MIIENNAEYSQEIENKILSLLDGWTTEEDSLDNSSEENISPFITPSDNEFNKIISKEEVENFYNLNLSKALIMTNRLNIDDLDTLTLSFFIDGVCYLTASNLWQKYNIRVSNDELEDQFIQSYGGLLYKQGKDILDRFIVTHISNYHGQNKNINNDVWLI